MIIQFKINSKMLLVYFTLIIVYKYRQVELNIILYYIYISNVRY